MAFVHQWQSCGKLHAAHKSLPKLHVSQGSPSRQLASTNLHLSSVQNPLSLSIIPLYWLVYRDSPIGLLLSPIYWVVKSPIIINQQGFWTLLLWCLCMRTFEPIELVSLPNPFSSMQHAKLSDIQWLSRSQRVVLSSCRKQRIPLRRSCRRQYLGVGLVLWL